MGLIRWVQQTTYTHRRYFLANFLCHIHGAIFDAVYDTAPHTMGRIRNFRYAANRGRVYGHTVLAARVRVAYRSYTDRLRIVFQSRIRRRVRTPPWYGAYGVMITVVSSTTPNAMRDQLTRKLLCENVIRTTLIAREYSALLTNPKC